MAPKIEVSNELIEQLLKEHFEKQTNDSGVKRHMKKHAGGYVRLVGAVGMLTVAINAYVDLQKENLDLAKENRVLFTAIASKVNHMAERMAYMDGRLEGMKPEEAEKAVGEKIKPLEANGTPRVVGPTMKSKGKKKDRHKAKTMTKPPEPHVVRMEIDPSGMQQMAPALKVSTYEQLPEDLAELLELEEQAQEKLQEENGSN